MKMNTSHSFADIICDLRVRKIKSQFFNQVNMMIDWDAISKTIDLYYKKGNSVVGKPSYDGVLLFKMSLLQTWYGLSDYEVEDRINDSISFSQFCGLTLEQPAPDHSTLSRFRKAMTQEHAYDKLLAQINAQFEEKNIIVKQGVIIDASVIDTPLKPKGKAKYEVAEDRKEDERSVADTQAEQEEKEILRSTNSSADADAAWIKKSGQLRYGFKKHMLTDKQGLVLGVVTTAANVNEVSNLEAVLDTVVLEENTEVYADKGYQSEKNQKILAKKKLTSRILHKAKKNKPLTSEEKKINKEYGGVRYQVERTFGSIKIWFKSSVARYKGIAKMHTQNVLESIAYNLYRCPAIVGSM